MGHVGLQAVHTGLQAGTRRVAGRAATGYSLGHIGLQGCLLGDEVEEGHAVAQREERLGLLQAW